MQNATSGVSTAACWATPLALVLSLISGLPASAERPEPPPFYAVRDARVVIGTGETLERATVLIADGLIEAVGADLTIPADAWEIDGEGLVLYPGLIDGMTDIGLKSSDQAAPGSGGGRPSPESGQRQIRGPEDRPATQPWRNAADLQGDDDARIKQWRQAGFTAALTVPADGFFAGQAAIIHLGDAEGSKRVLATPVAQRIGFRGGSRRSFPASLMGGFAYVRQVLSDAEHYGRVSALYDRSPIGRQRPVYDRTLEPLHAAVESGLPFLIPASHGREIDRALKLADAWDLRAVLFGGHGAYTSTDRLRAGSASVLMSLDWPEAGNDADPDADTPLPELYHRRKAPASPALLHQAGVPFAFMSDGLSSPAKIFAGVRAAIDAGLPGDAAIEALTLGAAHIFGVGDRLGSIEAGKVANLVLASAEPWVEDVESAGRFHRRRQIRAAARGRGGKRPAGKRCVGHLGAGVVDPWRHARFDR